MKPICAEWEERLSLYVDGLLNPFDENAVEAHLSRCEACRAAVALWREIGESVRRLPRELPPADLRTRILAGTTRKPSLVQRLRLGWWHLAPALGAGLLLAYWTLPRMPSHDEPSLAGTLRMVDSAQSDLPDQSVQPAVEAHPANSDTRVVIVVQPAPSPRWHQPSPRWVISTRAPAPSNIGASAAAPTQETTPASFSREIALSTSPPAAPSLITEVADLPVQTESAGAENPSNHPERPSANTDTTPTKGTVALSQWSEQFNRQLQEENRRPRLKQTLRDQRDSRFLVPIFSWNIR